MTTPNLWHALHNANDYAPLYFHLRMSKRSYRGWSSYDTSVQGIILFVFNIFIAPFLSLIPFLAIFLVGTYWAGFIAAEIRKEHTSERFDLLALLPGGAGNVYWTLAVMHMRNSPIYQYTIDGLRITTLVGGMVIFVLTSGLSIAFFQPNLNTGEIYELVNMTLTTIIVFSVLYVQQIQAVILAQVIGMFIPTYTVHVIEARIGASLTYFCIQIFTYIIFVFVAFGLIPDLTRDAFIFTSSLSLFVGSGGLIIAQELCIAFMWRRVQTVYGTIHLEQLTA